MCSTGVLVDYRAKPTAKLRRIFNLPPPALQGHRLAKHYVEASIRARAGGMPHTHTRDIACPDSDLVVAYLGRDLDSRLSSANRSRIFSRSDRRAPKLEARHAGRWHLAGLQGVVVCRRRCSLAFMISFMSPAGRISKMLPYFRAGCCAINCTA